MQKSYYVYILQTSDSSFYTGATSDLPRRVYEHETGAVRTAYTYSRRPVKLLWAQECSSREESLRLEHQVKGWSRAKKIALIQNDYEKVHEIVKQERQRREGLKRASTTLSTGASIALSTGASTAVAIAPSVQHPERSATQSKGALEDTQ